MNIQELATLCQEDSRQYQRGVATKAENCFELMRIALAENNNAALTEIYRNYRGLIKSWVLHHPGFVATEESAEYFMLEAFSSFYFALRHERFTEFDSIAKLLKYLKACVHTVILLYLRKQRLSLVPIENLEHLTSGKDAGGGLMIAAIWERICQLLPAEQDQELAHLAFVQERKPAAIAAIHPDVYENPRAVSVALQRIRNALRKDNRLRELLGIEGASQ